MLRLTTGCGRGGRRAAAVFASSSAPASSLSPFTLASVWPQSQPQTQVMGQLRPVSTTPSLSSAGTVLSRAHTSGRMLLPGLLSGALRQQQHVRLTSNKSSPSSSSSSSSPSSSPPTDLATAAPTLPPTTTTKHENIYTIPNFLTAARLIAAPVIGYLIVADQPGWALSLLATAAVTDVLDGWIARHWNLHTVVGSVIDPMADKVLMTVLAISLAAQGSLPMWLAVLILGRDVGLAISAIYYRWVSLPPPKTFSRYWDFSLPSAEVRPTTISKYNTFLQLALMGVTTAAPVLAASTGAAAAILGGPYDLGPALTVLQYIVAVTTVWSGASYVYSKDAVKILSQKAKKP